MEHNWSKLLYHTLITRVSLLLVFIRSQIENHKLAIFFFTADALVWSLIPLSINTVWGWEVGPNKIIINIRDIVVHFEISSNNGVILRPEAYRLRLSL